MIDNNAADYCPCCGQPREMDREVSRLGMRLTTYFIIYNGKRVRLRPAVAKFARPLFERGTASHEMLRLRLDSEAEDLNLNRVYAKFLRHALEEVTGGAILLKSIWGWGYELIEASDERIAA